MNVYNNVLNTYPLIDISKTRNIFIKINILDSDIDNCFEDTNEERVINYLRKTNKKVEIDKKQLLDDVDYLRVYKIINNYFCTDDIIPYVCENGDIFIELVDFYEYESIIKDLEIQIAPFKYFFKLKNKTKEVLYKEIVRVCQLKKDLGIV